MPYGKSKPLRAKVNDTVNSTPAPTNDDARHSNVNRFLNLMDPIVAGLLPQIQRDGPGYLSWEGAKLSLEILKSISDTTRILAETDRIEAARWGQTEHAEIKAEGGSSEITKDTSQVQESTVKGVNGPVRRQLDMSSNVFNGFTGSVSWRDLEEMSEGKLEELDEILKEIAQKIVVSGFPWDKVGQMIMERLVKFGFQFQLYGGEYSSLNWVRVFDSNQSDLSRVSNAIDYCTVGDDRRFANEMLQVAQRLMVARGFQF